MRGRFRDQRLRLRGIAARCTGRVNSPQHCVALAAAILVGAPWLPGAIVAQPALADGPGPQPPGPVVPVTGTVPSPDPMPASGVVRKVKALVPVIRPVLTVPVPRHPQPGGRAAPRVARPPARTRAAASIGASRPAHARAAYNRARPAAANVPVVARTPRAMLSPVLARLRSVWSLGTAVLGSSRRGGGGLVLLLGALALVILAAGSLSSLRIVMRLERDP